MANVRNDPYQCTKSFTPREYQVELLDKAKSDNVIVCLGTGTGKTFIAVMLIKEFAYETRLPFNEGGKRTMFLVNNVTLVQQQAEVIRDHSDLKVGEYIGESVSAWNSDVWNEQFMENQVLVMTSQIFLDLLNHSLFSFRKCNLIILDECHHAVKRHPMREIMRTLESYSSECDGPLPKILGLTASIIKRKIKPRAINDEILELERTLRSTAETTSDIVNISKYETNAKEYIVEFQSVNSEKFLVPKTSLNDCFSFLNDFFRNGSNEEEKEEEEEYEVETSKSPAKTPCKMISTLLLTLQTLGAWCALKLTFLLIEELEKEIASKILPNDKLLLQVSQTRIHIFQKQLEEIIQDDGSYERLVEYSSQKILKLLEILSCAHEEIEGRSSDNSFESCPRLSVIVFVQRRDTAFLLEKFLLEVAKRNSTFSMLHPCHLVGKSCLKSNQSFQFGKFQDEVIRKFRIQEVNILIATSVAEEGLDIPKCNLVIRFDQPTNYCSYIQSKGRARHPKSSYVLMIEDTDMEKFVKTVDEFHEIEEILLRQSIDSTLPSTEEISNSFSDELYPPYKPFPGPDSPKITISSAISMINTYCAKLPSDTFTRLTAKCKIKTIPGENEGNLHKCTVYLPVNSSVKFPIEGEFVKSKQLSKMIASLKACQILHEHGELDDNLLPLSKETMKFDDILDTDDEDEVDYKKSVGTTKKRRYYTKKVAQPLKNSFPIANQSCYLYVIDMKLTCPIPEEQNTRGRPLYDPGLCKQCLAILSSKPIPPRCGFQVYTRSGEVSVNISDVILDNLKFNNQELEKLTIFHQFIFNDVLRLKKDPMKFCDTNSSYLIIPLLSEDYGYVVDWKFTDKICGKDSQSYLKPSSYSDNEFKFDKSNFDDAVVMPCYRNLDQPQFFYVAEIFNHMNPNSEFPDREFKTFAGYFSQKYKAKITSYDQPLLDVDHTSARLNLLTPRCVNRKGIVLPTSSKETKRARRENLQQKQIFVPELCLIHPVPASLWKKIVCLPSILYRLNCLLLADELRTQVAIDLNLSLQNNGTEWPPLNFGWNLSDAFKERDKGDSNPPIKNILLNGNSKVQTDNSENAKNFITDVEDEKLKMHNICDTNSEKGIVCVNSFIGNIKHISDDFDAIKFSDSDNIGSSLDDVDFKILSDKMPLVESVNGLQKFEESETDEILDKAITNDLSIDEIDKSVATTLKKLPVIYDTLDYEQMLKQLEFENMIHLNEVYESSDDESFNGNHLTTTDSFINETMLDYCKNFKENSESMETYCNKPFDASDASDEDINDEYVDDFSDDLSMADIEILDPLNQFELFSKHSDGNEVITETNLNNIDIPVNETDFNDKQNKSLTQSKKSIDLTQAEQTHDPLAITNDKNSSNNDLITDKSTSIFEEKMEFSVGNSEEKKLKCKPNIQFGDLLPNRDTDRFVSDEEFMNFSFDKQFDLSDHPGPDPGILLQALTMSNANDGINLERLETIGDSFLKYAISVFLYCDYNSIHEGKLSYLRSKQVSNMNLFKLGKKRNLGEYMVATKFEPSDNWLPPCFFLPGSPNHSDGFDESHSKENASKKQEKVSYNLLIEHSIPDKSIADCVEALIGAYLISCGTEGALLFMSWLGIKVLPKFEDPSECKNFLRKPLKSPLIESYTMNPHENLKQLLSGYDVFEKEIGYTFTDKAYLLQAFTHASYYYNRITDCYQRLEFLGDAVLDYLITRHLYEDSRQHSPGALTDLRSALVNNTFFAALAVKYKFYKYFKAISPGLFELINKFVKIKNYESYDPKNYQFNEEECDINEEEDIEVPKALGDIFESVAGAIYLDSGMSLDAVWKVYYTMMKPEIEQFSNNVPKSPIRELLELEPETAKFMKPKRTIHGKIRVVVEIFGKGSFEGVGRNYKIAKCTAAKRALNQLRKMDTS